MTEPASPQPSEPAPEWGAPAPRPRWSGKKTAAAAAIAVGIAATGGVAVYAASGTSSSEQGGGPGGMMTGGGPMMRLPEGLASALHGEYTVPDGKGGYTTEVMQLGEVTEISATSVAVKSEDGYTKTYPIDGNTTFGRGSLDDIAGGDTVTVTAAPGEGAAAKTISERVIMGGPQGGQQDGGQQAPRNGQQPPGN
ncbi:hypothetical protein [Amycolatopsis albispora]|uniref:DUF5666 domain-containing protein n=1 Tax=Amycolatopsis albispora TaxID=1804986 RepID=A0A344LJF2_9PSEU|nr:hypothetical protein [Amycolatopsis albispora]AXB48176.1 hypothetical protein A4R43_41820 [Amycolatopsis albispora]